jgi:hypothetical protein
MSDSEFASSVFDDWNYTHLRDDPNELHCWKRDDVVAEMCSSSDAWSVWIRVESSVLEYDTGFDKQDGFRFLRNQLRAVNQTEFDEE